jgi:protein phosphatase 1 regulatory subunit 11
MRSCDLGLSGPSVVSCHTSPVEGEANLDSTTTPAFVVSPDMQAPRPTTAEHGSRTILLTDAQPREGPHADRGSPSTRVAPQGGVLRLRGGPRNTQRVVWREDVVDNEGCGKKSSKSMLPPSFWLPPPLPLPSFIAHKVPHYILTRSPVCCIYHKPRAFGESSSESSSDSDSGDSRHDHPYPRRSRHNGHRHAHRPSSDSDRTAALPSPAGNTAHASSSTTATGTQDPVHERSDSDSENAYEARPSQRYKAYRAEDQRHS